MSNKPSIIAVADPIFPAGGNLRALRSLREYPKHFETYLFLLSQTFKGAQGILKDLLNAGVRIAGYSDYYIRKQRSRILGLMYPLIFPAVLKSHIRYNKFDGVVVLNEYFEIIYLGNLLGNLFEIPRLAFLQTTPFYGSKERLRKIFQAYILWHDNLMDNLFYSKMVEIRTILGYNVLHGQEIRLLRKYDAIISVSRAIPLEMGNEWVDKVISLDPGVSLDDEDLRIIQGIKSRVREKSNYIVFGGRPSPEKGLIEALLVFSAISRRYRDLKLVVTGDVSSSLLVRLRSVCRRLGIEDKVIFTGYLPRGKRFEVVARARLMLYPSHIDSFSYAVLESLHLGTPVVGYRIPALEIYYGKQPGVKLVDEGDVEALTVETMNVLERKADTVEPPRIKTWSEILNEEISIIKAML